MEVKYWNLASFYVFSMAIPFIFSDRTVFFVIFHWDWWITCIKDKELSTTTKWVEIWRLTDLQK